jgi:VCBS repeat-containing protein
MATYTHNEIAVPGGAQWYDVNIDANNPTTASSTLLVLPNSDGTETHIIGTDFIYDVDGNPTGGSVTQINRTSSDGATVYETVTGVGDGIDLVSVFLALTSTPDDGNRSFFALIFSDVDAFNGFSGDDLFVGGGFGDSFDGGSGGTDTVSYDNALDGVRVNLSHPPANTGDAAGDTYTSIENLIGSDFNDSLTGNSSDNVLSGGLGDDSFGLTGGADTMIGGAGNDSYLIDGESDLVIENPGEGFDTVIFSFGGTIGPNIEVLALADGTNGEEPFWGSGIGNELDNVLSGNSAPNALYGMEGDDFLWGRGAYSWEFGDLGDTLVGGAGNDTFFFVAYEANGDEVLDFTGNGTLAGDSFRFVGFGTAAQGATFTQIGATNQWQIHSGLDGHNDYITLVNGASVDASDYVFEGAPGNTAPVAWGDNYQINEDQALNIAAAGVLLNVTDADHDPLTAVLVSGAQHGTVALDGNGSFIYTPDLNYNGPDSFMYQANDGQADSNIAFVSLIVNPVDDTPVASNDSYATNEDTVLTVNTASGVLLNDTDADHDPLTAVLVSGAQHGTVALDGNGSFIYTPDLNYNGPDGFIYKAFDGSANSDVTTVLLTVDPVNDAPSAGADVYSTASRTKLIINAATGVLQNDSDIDGNPIAAELVTPTAHGKLTLNADGSFTYVPKGNYNGQDSFVYHATDGAADSNDITVQINVGAGNVSTTHDLSGDGSLPAIWTMDGTTPIGSAVLPNPGSDWHVV